MAVAVYLTLLLIFRIAGKRTLSEITTFDFVLLLIISEAVQQASIGTDNSMTNSFLVVFTLVGLDIALSVVKRACRASSGCSTPGPSSSCATACCRSEAAAKERMDEDDVLSAARCLHGLERMDQVKHAVLESGGKISIIPREPSRG